MTGDKRKKYKITDSIFEILLFFIISSALFAMDASIRQEIMKDDNDILIALVISAFTMPSLLHSLSQDRRLDKSRRENIFYLLIPLSIISGMLMSCGLVVPYVEGFFNKVFMIFLSSGISLFVVVCASIIKFILLTHISSKKTKDK